MSASGKSSNRLSEYRRGRSFGTGHGIYAAAGKRDRARDQARREAAARRSAVEPEPEVVMDARDLGEVCTSMDIDMCAVHGIGTPWRREWNRTHPQDGSPDDRY